MRALLLLSFLGTMILTASSPLSSARHARLVLKGEKSANRLCESRKLPAVTKGASLQEIERSVRASGACVPLGRSKMEALVAYLAAGSASQEKEWKGLAVPHDAKCPVCGMFVSKYPKWAAEMIVAGKKHYFDGVKDMMKYYFFDGDFPYDRSKIEAMKVTDYYTLEPIDARKAWYVIGSEVHGPMGNELIPFKDEVSAKNFLRDHKGEKILRFEEITPKMVMGLDGIELN